MSHVGGDNHFVSARERDLGPLLVEARAKLKLGEEQGRELEGFLETAWLAGTRSGHAKLMNQAIRHREEHFSDVEEAWETKVEPVNIEEIEAEFKAMMEASAAALDLSAGRTVVLWDFLSRAWTAGFHTYESEVMASLIERRGDLADELRRWLAKDERDAD